MHVFGSFNIITIHMHVFGEAKADLFEGNFPIHIVKQDLKPLQHTHYDFNMSFMRIEL
jgi:hypothetical protein